MKTLSPFSAFVFLLLLVVMIMVMIAQASDLFGKTNADPEIAPVESSGKLYYIHKDNYTDFQVARDNCAADGGMLVEIKDWSEFHVVEDYLALLSNRYKLHKTVIGGKYQPDDSQWVFASTGTPLPFITFSSYYYYPGKYDPEIHGLCLGLLKFISPDRAFMVDVDCHLDNPELIWPPERYMCEKIYAPYHPTQLPNADPNIRAVEFRDKIYYIHKKLFTDYQANSQDCKADGGMLAEIDDDLEFLVVQKYVKSTLSCAISHVFIGGVKTSNGWVLPSTNQPLPYVRWGHHEPFVYGLPISNCLILLEDKGWNMASMYCESNSFPDYRFLCEKPKDN